MGHDQRTLTLWQVRAVCFQGEPTGRVIIVIVTQREEKRERDVFIHARVLPAHTEAL